MERKKKKLTETEESTVKISGGWGSDVTRSVLAVFLFCLALVMLLGFFDKAGVAGRLLNGAASFFIGWTKFVFPIFSILAGIILLLRKETSFYISKLIGLSVSLIGLAGLIHWFFDIEKMAVAAKAGEGGGYTGYALAFISVKFLSKAGGLVVILAIFLVGFIIVFNFSIAHFFGRIIERRSKLNSGVEEEKKEEADKEIEDNIDIAVKKKNKKELLEEKKEEQDSLGDNIARIEFVEGPDQYVDEKLLRQKTGRSGSGKNGFQTSLNNHSKSGNQDWKLPSLDLLEKSSGVAKGGDVNKNAEIIEKTLKHFGIDVERGEVQTGPSVTQYSFRPAVGVKISRILALQNDLALALAAHPIRIEAPIPGKSLIGIEVPNKVSAIVRLRDILESEGFADRGSNLSLALGEDVSGNYIFGNLNKMPHLLIAGATGTGKSVCINSVLLALLYQNSPRDLKLIMVDPKRVELALYNGIPHLLSDVIVENGKVVGALRWAVREMERRYRVLQDHGSRDVSSFNEKVRLGLSRKYNNPETGKIIEEKVEKLPFIVIVIDELADLMGSHGKEVEGAIVRIAQMARAVGIHLILSTQRPSVEVITGLIKANITTRIAFQVATQIDSRTILDMAGAEKLIGSGDMLYLSASSPKPRRIQGVFVSESEVKRVVKAIKNQGLQKEGVGEDILASVFSQTDALQSDKESMEFKNVDEAEERDIFYEQAKQEVTRAGKASASLLQRRLRVGYARAARLMDLLEEKGIIGPADGAKPREVYEASTDLPEVRYEDPVSDQERREKWQI